MPIYKQTTEITKIDDVWANIDRDIVEVYFGDKNIFTVWGEYDSTLPITINANGDALLDYRIYGADGGVGVATENLFDKNTITPNSYLKSDGSVRTLEAFLISDFIPVEEGEYLAYRTRAGLTGCYNCIYDENKNFLRSIYTNAYQDNVLMTIGSNEKYIRISANIRRTDVAMVVKGSTAPTEYEPYGYKLPMVTSDGTTDIDTPVYIGENQLMEDEYVSYGEQKIYRDVGGTLTPTDPPVPLPEIPTIDGTTIIDYDGTPKPSQMYVKYRKQYS